MREEGYYSWGGDYLSQDFNYPKSDIEGYAPITDVPEFSFWRFLLHIFIGESYASDDGTLSDKRRTGDV